LKGVQGKKGAVSFGENKFPERGKGFPSRERNPFPSKSRTKEGRTGSITAAGGEGTKSSTKGKN